MSPGHDHVGRTHSVWHHLSAPSAHGVGVPITATSAGAKSHHAGGNAHAMGFAKEKALPYPTLPYPLPYPTLPYPTPTLTLPLH